MRPFRNANDSSRGRSYPTNDAPLLHSELQNLDMELEILKRQREIIFKQRQVENQLFSQRLNTFNEQTSSSFGHLEPNPPHHSYSSSYSLSYNPSSSKGYKRSSDRSYDPLPKQSRNDWANTKHKHNKPQPLMNVPTQQYKKAKTFPNKPKPLEPKATNATTRYRPPKVPSSRTEVNKSSPKTAAPIDKKKFSADDILRPDVVPSSSVNGRLELALGEIIKCIKTSPQLTEDQKRQLMLTGMRSVKSLIRQRIFAVMMNKQVRTKAEIEAIYRKTYKKDVDNEIIEAIETSYVRAGFKKMPPIVIKNISGSETARIHKFFRAKINMLLKNKMQSMIDSLIKLHGDNEEEILDCLKDLPELEDKEPAQEPKIEADVEMNDSSDTANKPEDIAKSADTENNAAVENNPAVENNTAAENANDNATNVEAEEKTADNATVDLTSEENGTEKPQGTDNEDDTVLTHKEEARIKIKQYYKLMDLLIENRLPKLLLQFKDEFANLMYCEKDFIVAKELIMRELKDTLRQSLEVANDINRQSNDVDKLTNQQSEGEKEMENKTDKPEQMEITKNVVKPLPQEQKTQMCVMLLGKPALPAKALIYDFLSKFNPKSIKKHKTVNNLLVVSFESKEDYDSILQQNETKVGDATFTIKANEVVASDKHKEKTEDEADSEVNDSQNTDESKEDQAQEIKGTEDETNYDDQGSNEKILDETEEVTENAGENEQKTDATGAQADDEKNDVIAISDDITEVTDKNNEEKVENFDESNKVDDSNGATASGNGEKAEENNDIDMIEGTDNNKNEEVNNLETIQETEETDKAKTRARAVATPTRTSSRLANVTPSTIKTRRTSRLAQ